MYTDKYVEFDLPRGAAGMATALGKKHISYKLHQLCNEYNLNYYIDPNGSPYKLKVYFGREEDITLFFLLWQPDNYSRMPVVYESRKSKKL